MYLWINDICNFTVMWHEGQEVKLNIIDYLVQKGQEDSNKEKKSWEELLKQLKQGLMYWTSNKWGHLKTAICLQTIICPETCVNPSS